MRCCSWAKVLSAKPDHLCLVLETHGGMREATLENCPLTYTHAIGHTHTHTQMNKINNCKKIKGKKVIGTNLRMFMIGTSKIEQLLNIGPASDFFFLRQSLTVFL